MSSNVQNGQSPKGYWLSLAPYMVPPLAATCAIVPAYTDLVKKSAEQRGELATKMTAKEWTVGVAKTAPTVGGIIAVQMFVQPFVENWLKGDEKKESLLLKFESAAIVGVASSPFLAVFNGLTNGSTFINSLRMFSPKQCLAISVQETAFVGGLVAADSLAAAMKEQFGDNKVVEYTATFTAGAWGSLAGHPANTALTLWQKNMSIDSVRQLSWGAARKARAIGVFAVGYKYLKEKFNEGVEHMQ
jgi:hypothetical protein